MRFECFGRENKEVSRERSKKMISGSHKGGLYRTTSKSRQMQVSRGIEVSVEEVSRKCLSTAEISRRYQGTTHQNQEQKLDRSTRCREAIEDTDPILIYPLGIEVLARLR